MRLVYRSTTSGFRLHTTWGRLNPPPHDSHACEQGHGDRKQSHGRHFKSHEAFHSNNSGRSYVQEEEAPPHEPTTVGLASVQLLWHHQETGCVLEATTYDWHASETDL